MRSNNYKLGNIYTLLDFLRKEKILSFLIIIIVAVGLMFTMIHKRISPKEISVGIIILTIIILSFRDPFLLILIFILTDLSPSLFDRFGVNLPFFGQVAPRRILGFLAVIILLIKYAITRQKFKFGTPWIWVIFLSIMSSVIISNITAPYPEAAKTQIITWFQNVVFVFLLINILDSIRKINALFIMYILTTAVNIFYIFYHRQFDVRTGGFAFDPNFLAQIIIIAFSFILSRLPIIKNFYTRVFYFLLLVFIPIEIILTRSRSGFICLVLVSFFYITRFRTNWKYVVVAMLVLSILIVYLPSKYTERVIGTFQKVKEKLPSEARFKLGKVAFDMFKRKPIFGNGSGSFWYEFGTKYSYGIFKRQRFLATHSIYLTFLAEYGLFGLISLLSFIIYSFVKFVKLLKLPRIREDPEFFLTLFNNFVLFITFDIVIIAFFSGIPPVIFTAIALSLERLYEEKYLTKEPVNQISKSERDEN
ncbi:MAG: O-antigen ligase family protein [bacterium]